MDGHANKSTVSPGKRYSGRHKATEEEDEQGTPGKDLEEDGDGSAR